MLKRAGWQKVVFNCLSYFLRPSSNGGVHAFHTACPAWLFASEIVLSTANTKNDQKAKQNKRKKGRDSSSRKVLKRQSLQQLK